MRPHSNNYAILPGSFDPIHNGHLELAEYAAHHYAWERVYFIPSAHFPNRATPLHLSGRWRVRLCRAALAERATSRLALLAHEVTHHRPGYLIDTVRALQQRWRLRASGPHPRVNVLLGSDLLHELANWKEIDELSHLTHIYLFHRPHLNNGNYNTTPRTRSRAQADQTLLTTHGFPHTLCDNPPLPVSSSEIRQRIARQQSIADLVPDSVERLIRQHRLYQ